MKKKFYKNYKCIMFILLFSLLSALLFSSYNKKGFNDLESTNYKEGRDWYYMMF